MKIWFFSDTHGQHHKLLSPFVDVAICCGDEANSRDPAINASESFTFFQWYSRLTHIPTKIFVPGNHSVAIERGWVDVPRDISMLVNQSLTLANGMVVYGSPYTPEFGKSWAYMRKRSKLHDVWSLVPDNTDILVTHGPPLGVLDLAWDYDDHHPVQTGCRSLLKRVLQVQPKIHAFGHIHRDDDFLNAGTRTLPGCKTQFINCAVTGHHKGEIVQHGLVVEV